MRSYLPPVTGMLLVFLLGLAFLFWRQQRSVQDLRAVLSDARVAAEQQQESARRTQRAQAAELREAHVRITQLTDELERVLATADRTSDAAARLRENPAYAEVQARQQRRLMQERYGDLFTRLELSADALERCKQLLVELASSRTVAPASADGSGARPAAEIENELRALLGEENYAAYETYGYELTQVRPQVNRFASDAADAGVPLSGLQRSALARAISEVTHPRQPARAPSGKANEPDAATGLTPLDELVLARATEILSPAQLQLFRDFRVQERQGLEAWRRLATP